MAVKSSGHKSIKHDIIEKANNYMFISVSIAVFVVVFCLFATKALIDRGTYQQEVISRKQETLKVLENNRREAESLRESYVSFATEQINVLGGNPAGTGPRDGDNAKLVLDALPSELDFPALSSSVEKILLDGGYGIQSIGGDDSGFGSGNTDENSDSTETIVTGQVSPVEIEFPFSVNASPESSLSLLQTLELSIRPFKLLALSIEGSGTSLELGISMKTYYQPQSTLQVTEEVVQ